ncbi:histidine kinase/DNA gyrase B/HSP90-like ATPase [Christiangramia gaetbulicola]|uniref:histidine kinase n=1 Tax=Christiangramia gaetbulicola TaxID=703340 RepID=A0A2T6AK37_9FLAO|nr:tetratricopeptide repeat-containing sensor histidine kinase [Christiangramia gaetbulicola]PTX44174.1 histidine kinase/DNA gyrase B/HSP90-like ATPase [Christiangramia gaetbulicola]
MNKRLLILILYILGGCSGDNSRNKSLKINSQELEITDKVSRDSLLKHIKSIPIDSQKLKNLFDFSYHYLRKRNRSEFLFWNNKTLELSEKLQDTSKIAESYWDLGSFYYNTGIYDSAYYYYSKSYNDYSIIEDIPHAAKMLYSMGIVQKDLRDYQGSENTTIDAIKLFERVDDEKGIYYGYNNLAVIYNNYEQYDVALSFHEQALAIAENLGQQELIAISRNNIGVVQKNLENYLKAVENFNKGLELDSIKRLNPKLYARLIDNLAYTKLISSKYDLDPIYKDLIKSKNMRESLQDQAGVSISNIHLAEFYLKKEDTNLAKKQFLDAYQFAREIESASDMLYTLQNLGEIDDSRSKDYLQEYIRISDSLTRRERRVRNKFARTKYQIDKIEKVNQKLITQRELIIGISLGSILIISLLSFLISQRIRNKKLQLEQNQTRNNQEIYELLLSQHGKLEEGRRIEKERISRELHDGVLGKLFGIRFLLSNLTDPDIPQERKAKKKYLGELKEIEEEIRSISHNLSKSTDLFKEDFKSIIEKLIQREQDQSKLNFKLILKDKYSFLNNLPITFKVNIYRIIQEAIYNVIKHSNGSECKVFIKTSSEKMILRIIDNGKGFDPNEIKRGIGLKNIGNRINEMDGVWNIFSEKGKTEIRVLLNYNNE